MDSGLGRRFTRLGQQWRQRFTRRQERWLEKRVPSVPSVQLGQRSIFILPTWQGAIFGLGSIIILIIAVAERNPFSVLLSTLLLSLFLLGLVLCYRNLSGLKLVSLDQSPAHFQGHCFAGEKAQFMMTVSASGRQRAHRDIKIGFSSEELQALEIGEGGSSIIELTTKVPRRGIFQAPRLLLQTRYPSGLWQAWSRPHLDMQYLVYPRPTVCSLPDVRNHAGESNPGQQSSVMRSGVDDFTGLRNYYPGDSRRRIAWHALARGQGLKTKQFVREDDSSLMLTPSLYADQEMESALSCLCFQIIQLSNRRQQKIGLQLPGCRPIKPGEGEIHKHKMLQALALWE